MTGLLSLPLKLIFFFTFLFISLLSLGLFIFFLVAGMPTGQESPLMLIQKHMSQNNKELNYFLVFELKNY
jgi:hypothetical protein